MLSNEELIEELKSALDDAAGIIMDALERADDELQAYEYDIAQARDDEMMELKEWNERARKMLDDIKGLI